MLRSHIRRIIIAVVFFVVFYALLSGLLGVYKNKSFRPVSTPVVVSEPDTGIPKHTVIGKSVEGRPIEAYTYGNGKKQLVFVGGIHGGYEWNSVFLAYKFIDYLDANPNIIPNNITVNIIPSANPDGIYKVTGKVGRFTLADIPVSELTIPGRMNTNGVDLNRNFDCNWQATSTWQSKEVSAGTAVFSEPEARAIRDFILKDKPKAVVFWHSQANSVYASQCNNGVLPETLSVMNVYAQASGYSAVESFDAYVVTGAAEDWLASINIPAITVELKTHDTIEWEQNLAAVNAVLNYYNNQN